MRTLTHCTICLFSLLLFAGAVSAADGKLMHCFAFTAVDDATDADWQAWFKATDALPGKIPGLTKVWYGKLARPLTVFGPDAETRKNINKDSKDVTGKFNILRRQWAGCMEFSGPDALKTYAAHPAHKAWEEVYSKVRVAGTTTYDMLSVK
jgi:hypothetical protein